MEEWQVVGQIYGAKRGMDLSLGNIVAIGMRVIQHRNEIARVTQKAIAQINQAEGLWGEVRAVLEKVAPELLIDLHVMPVVAMIEPPPQYDVAWVQQALNHLLNVVPPGRPLLKVDGIMGERTRDAVKFYQNTRGLDADGWVGMQTLAALDADIRDAHARAGR